MEYKDNYFSCDYCHRVGTGITIVNGFKMCPMCLAEYQHKSGENNELREELGKKEREVEQLKKENANLKVELVEKDKLLENAIVPKFKIGQEVFAIYTKEIHKIKIYEINTYTNNENKTKNFYIIDKFGYGRIEEQYIFATPEQAE